jgi:pimeloyl-ACP methyl ester carboxylesterase
MKGRSKNMHAYCKDKGSGIILTAVMLILSLSVGCGLDTPTLVSSITPSNTTATPVPPTSTYTPLPAQAEDGTLTELDAKIPVGAYKLHIYCIGSGVPAVIMEAGWGDVGDTWSLVQPEVAKYTQACSYDRVGLGSSDPGPEPDTYLQAVTDLHILLENAAIKVPYILVGHSLGGMYILLYTHQYPEEVVGLVLVDSSHPDSFERDAAALPPETPNESESIKFYREWFASAIKDPTLPPELLEPGSLGNLPLVVITGTNKQRADDLPAELNAKFNQIWVELQKELALLSANSTHIITSKSGHFIQHDEPELVIDAILNLLAEVRP